MLEARAVFKQFRGQTVLEDVNLVVKPGEVIGLVGMNGSGKTTLLDILSGQARPDAGQVTLDGRPTGRARTANMIRTVFRSYQVPRLFYGLSVAENVALGRWAVASPTGQEDAGIAGLCSENAATTLSVGQRRRVVLQWVRERIGRAKYLLLDEPAAGGDHELIEGLMQLLAVARSEGCGVLLVEHRDGILQGACDRIVYLRDGKISDAPAAQAPVHSNRPGIFLDPQNEKHSLTVNDLAVSRGGALVVSGLTFRAAPGEVVVLTGANGSGKSSVLRTISGDPNSVAAGGRIGFGGKDIAGLPVRDRIGLGIQFMPQETTMFPSMTVEEVLRVGTDAVRPELWNGEAVSRVRSQLEVVDRIWSRRCGVLSGGERRLVSLARVLLLEPRVALLDEPLAGVDRARREQVVSLVRTLAEQGAAVVVAEQAGLAASFGSDRVVEIRPGVRPQSRDGPDA